MSLSLSLAPTSLAPPALPKRGRPRLALHRTHRLRHIRAAFRLRVEGWAPKKVASHFRVSLRTVYLWAESAPNYTDPEAEGLRRALEECSLAAASG